MAQEDTQQTRIGEEAVELAKHIAENPPTYGKKDSYESKTWKVTIGFDVYGNYDKIWQKGRVGGFLKGYIRYIIKEPKDLLLCYADFFNEVNSYQEIYEIDGSSNSQIFESYIKTMRNLYTKIEKKSQVEESDIDTIFELRNRFNDIITDSAKEYFNKLNEKIAEMKLVFKEKVLNDFKNLVKAAFYYEEDGFLNSSLGAAVDTSMTIWGELKSLSHSLSDGIITHTNLTIISKWLPILVTLSNFIGNFAKSKGLTEDINSVQNMNSLVNGLSSIFINPMIIATTYYGLIFNILAPYIGKIKLLIQEREAEYYKYLGEYSTSTPKEKLIFEYLKSIMECEDYIDIDAPVGDTLEHFETHREKIDTVLLDLFKARDVVIERYLKGKDDEIYKKLDSKIKDLIFSENLLGDSLGTPEKLPVTGVLLKDIDIEKFKPWVFKYRAWLWVMHYGSMATPDEAGLVFKI